MAWQELTDSSDEEDEEAVLPEYMLQSSY